VEIKRFYCITYSDAKIRSTGSRLETYQCLIVHGVILPELIGIYAYLAVVDSEGSYPREEIDIDDPTMTTLRLRGLLPEHSYRISIWARTSAGRGDVFELEDRTLPDGRKSKFNLSTLFHS